jgi:hypothetical protein
VIREMPAKSLMLRVLQRLVFDESGRFQGFPCSFPC